VADALFNRGVAKGMLGDRRGASDDFTAVVSWREHQGSEWLRRSSTEVLPAKHWTQRRRHCGLVEGP